METETQRNALRIRVKLGLLIDEIWPFEAERGKRPNPENVENLYDPGSSLFRILQSRMLEQGNGLRGNR